MMHNRLFVSFLWNTVGVFGHGVGYIVVTIILSRFLPPSDFGVVGVLLVLNSIASILIDGGFGQAIIRDRNITNDKLSSVFILNISIAFLLYSFLWAVTPFLCHFFKLAIPIWQIRLLFFTIIIESSTIMQRTMLVRNMDFRWLAFAQGCSTVIAGIAAVFVAMKQGGLLSLILYYVSYSLVNSVILWSKKTQWELRIIFYWTAVKGYLSFSINLLLSMFADRFIGNLESLLIGRFYTPADLAFFIRAKELDNWTGRKLIDIVLKTSYPALARIRDDEQNFKNIYRDILGITVFGDTFLMTLFILASGGIIELLWGSAWSGTEIYVLPWCLWGAFFPFQAICTNLFQVFGRTDLYLRLSVIRQILRICGIAFFAHISIISMTWAIVIASIAGGFLIIFYGSRLLGVSSFCFIWDSRITIIAAVVSYFLVNSADFYMKKLPLLLNVVCTGTVFAIAYLLCNLIFKNPYLKKTFVLISLKKNFLQS